MQLSQPMTTGNKCNYVQLNGKVAAGNKCNPRTDSLNTQRSLHKTATTLANHLPKRLGKNREKAIAYGRSATYRYCIENF
ncbi:hypothetical protein [Limnospira sp. PMC 289.06]|uniref:hypothetical protein n=1 Tax=Limnospira sp. PMC 289.06 TaxID=2981094 RepID=UPI0028E0DDB5|nr:hypothetical protein [Limnospira sp. PMC 289.06]